MKLTKNKGDSCLDLEEPLFDVYVSLFIVSTQSQ